MASKKCSDGCSCKRHTRTDAHRSSLSKAHEGKDHSYLKCEEGCTCKRHTRRFTKCEPDCSCNRHKTQSEEQRKRNSEANRGRKMSPEAVQKRVDNFKSRGLYAEINEKMQEGRRRALAEGLIKTPTYIDGRSNHPLYTRWYTMVCRCTYPHDEGWASYGGRGITVCQEWLEDPWAFYNYCDEVLGPIPEGYSIDRIDNDGNYEPGNIRWANWSEQNRNRRRKSIVR